VEQILDVSGLEPPEPLEHSLSAVEDLGPGDHLRILHRREPFPLYGILDARGFAHRTLPGSQTAFEILVWRVGDAAAETAVGQDVER
jgi:Uncharacterized conserved protein (DUF2249)